MTLQLNVPSIVCEGCADTITKAVNKLDPKAKVEVNLETKQVKAETEATKSAVMQAILDAGHTVE